MQTKKIKLADHSIGGCEGTLEALDDIVRFSAFGLLLWLAVLAIRGFRDRIAGWLGALAALTSAAYLISTKPGLHIGGVDLDLILLPVLALSPAFAWLFCLTQFDDNFELNRVHVGVVVAKLLSGACGYLAYKYGNPVWQVPLMAVSSSIVVGMLMHLIYVAVQGRGEDLVEARRRFRSTFVWAIIALSMGVLVAENFLVGRGFNQELLLVQAFSFLAITIYPLWRLSSPGGEDLFFRAPSPAVNTAHSVEDHCELSATDQHDLDVIKELAGKSLILEQGLTINKLSQQLNIPEHRLRHLINRHLGYRNFSDFLNHHRVSLAKEQLSNHKHRNMPVLTLAMELGYGSLGPFNRAFKERTGLTPTEFRNQSLEAGIAAAK